MTISIYQNLITKIRAILTDIPEIAEIKGYPTKILSKYPCVVFFPKTMSNEFKTQNTNERRYEFSLFVVVNSENLNEEDAINICQETSESVLEKLDSEWNFPNIDGHRVFCKVELGSFFISEAQSGLEATYEITLSVQLLTNNQ